MQFVPQYSRIKENNQRMNRIMTKISLEAEKKNSVQTSTLQFVDMANVRKASHHKGMRESLEVPHVANKMHPNSLQINDLWGTAMD